MSTTQSTVPYRRLGLARVTRLALLVTLVAGVAWPAHAAASITGLGKAGFGAIVVDNSRQHVFVSGPKANAVYELGFNGQLLATVPNVYGAWGMTISGNELYVAESTAGAIVRIDLSGATLTPSTVASGLNDPRRLVETGGKLWTTSSSGGQSAGIVSVEPGTGAKSTPEGSFYEPDLAASPGDPSTLFVTQDGLSPGSIYRFDVSSTPAKEVASNNSTDQENIEDLAVSADGTRVIPASGAPYLFEELSASTLEPDGLRYPGEAYPEAVAVSASGTLATAYGFFRESTLRLFALGAPGATFTAKCNIEVQPHGLALSADASAFFAVGYVGEETVLATPSSGCSPPPTPTPTPSPPTPTPGLSSPPPLVPAPSPPQLPRLQFRPSKPRHGRPDLYLELDPFRVTLELRASQVVVGYRYFFAAQHIRCLNGATNLIFTIAHVRRTTPCRPGPILISGQLVPHQWYEIRVQAVRERKHKAVKWGASYSGRLYMPGNEAHWTAVAQLPPAI